ncbi:MAG TPA: ABC transporter permease [Candidatus Limnocylindrales bacterium]|nr:ABC transporter permease [Candidatus Limnocylindrales bacterium]
MAAGVRFLEHNLLVYRRTWRGTAFSTIVSPILFLSAMGVMLGNLVPDLAEFGGASFLVFLAPGLLAATAMQTATIESSWPLLAGFKWNKTFQGAIATPQEPRDIVLGHLYSMSVRLAFVTGIFMVVAFAFGAIDSPQGLLAWPAAILTGLAFGMPMAAWTASRENESSFPLIFRFVITPMFLFSGTFFPIERLPEALQAVAWLTPLYHGVALARGFAIGQDVDLLQLGVHALVLIGLTVLGTLVALRTFHKRLIV